MVIASLLLPILLITSGSAQSANNGQLNAGSVFGGGLGARSYPSQIPASIHAPRAMKKIATEPNDAVAAFSTGNGTNAAILTNDSSITLKGQFNNSYWTLNGFSATYSLYMSPTADSTIFPSKSPLHPPVDASQLLTPNTLQTTAA